MSGKWRRYVSVLAGGAVAAGLLTATMASPASALSCGYNDNDNGKAVYRHCGNTTVRIETTNVFGGKSYQCVAPGDTVLGDTWFIRGSHYIGGVGCSPVTIPPR